MQKTAILGFGNPVRSDDGVGCLVIELLQQITTPVSGVTLLDMGTSAFEVLFQLQGHNAIILVDAVINSGEPDGTVFHLPASEVSAAIQDDPMVFLHALKWDQALSYARKILREDFPEDIQVYLIAVSDTRLEIGMSDPVRAAAQRVAELIQQSLRQRQIATAQ
ncbi:MAG: hydrogenase maturation protease [Lewinellaceae bacterium]|nr:hydrogenase maturation protease [Lewinellaceae bacterium]